MSDEKTYKLTGGPEGTGTIQRPAGVKTKSQKLKYDEAIRRRQKPGIYEKLDQMKQQAQAEYEKKIGKSRPTSFPSQQEDEGKAAFRQFFEEADKQPPVSGDYEPTEQDLEDEFEEFTDPGSKTLAQLADDEKSLQAIEGRRDRLKDVYDYSNLEDDSYIGTDEDGTDMYRMDSPAYKAFDHMREIALDQLEPMEYIPVDEETIQDKRDRGDPEQARRDAASNAWTQMLRQADADRQKKKEEKGRAAMDELNSMFESKDWNQ
jgi:hypothetical protein